MFVRFYRESDFKSICVIEKQAFGEGAYSNYMLKMMLKNPAGFTMVAEENSILFGYATMASLDASSVDLESIGVIPDQHHHGIGSMLLNAMEDEVKKRGYKQVILEVREKNIEAIDFYRKHGYTTSEFLNSYYSMSFNGSKNAYRMNKPMQTNKL